MLAHLRTAAVVAGLACACFAFTYAGSALALDRPRLQKLHTDLSSRLAVDYSADEPRAALLPPLSYALIKDAAVDNAPVAAPLPGRGRAGATTDAPASPVPSETSTPPRAATATTTAKASPTSTGPTDTPTPRPVLTPEASGTPTPAPSATAASSSTPPATATQEATCVIKILPGGGRTCITPIATNTPAPPTVTPVATDTPAPATSTSTPTTPVPTDTPDPGGSSGGTPG
jgi:hypothetical protein